MWKFASSCIAGNMALKNNTSKPRQDSADCSDDEASSLTSRDDGMECPICCESFNLVENIPYVLWCGHTLCKNCIIGLQWAALKFPTLPLQLPLFISCPWCNLLSLRLVYYGNLRFPRKNFFLLWMLESMNGDRVRSRSSACGDHQAVCPPSTMKTGSCTGSSINRRRGNNYGNDFESSASVNYGSQFERLHSSIKKSLVFFVHLTSKFPLVIIFLLIVLYVVPASAAILALYLFITVAFALPSLSILCFAYPSLDWLVREIVA
ncbi:hypothetical protein ABFS83_08G027900 [Erythranthe nasuta]